MDLRMTERTRLLCLCGLLAVSAACHRSTANDHVQRGMQFVEDKKDQEAIVEFRLAVQADPRLGDARLKLADAYRRVSDAKNALREYVRAADLLPKNIDAQIKAGQFFSLPAPSKKRRHGPTTPSRSTQERGRTGASRQCARRVEKF